ncbi:type III-D CRISPR-associated protein Csx19 [Trichothermofontia sp.]
MTNPTPTTLYSYCSKQQVSLEDTITHCGDVLKDAIALLYSPIACQFLRLSDGVFQDSDGNAVNSLTEVFEARIFTQNCELRWVNCDSGMGKAVVLSESEQAINQFTFLESIACESLKQKYILWGQKAKKQPSQVGWQRLAEARIGKLDVPIDSKVEDRVYLKTHEYLAAVDNYGNFAVIEERLLGLEVK